MSAKTRYNSLLSSKIALLQVSLYYVFNEIPKYFTFRRFKKDKLRVKTGRACDELSE